MSKELADRIVECGVGYTRAFSDGIYYCISSPNEAMHADEFVNDGRVVLALMEKMKGNVSLAVAICEACCTAIEQSKQT